LETSYRDEQYTVYNKVQETAYQDQLVPQTRMITETAERLEPHTSYRAVPVIQYQSQQVCVQRPVVETQYQPENVVSYRPVTTYHPQVVDAGGYVAQQSVTPGSLQYGLQFVPNAYLQTGPLGLIARPRGGIFWVPQATPPVVQTQLAYQPNYVTQQVPQTSMVPEVHQQLRPVQVTRMQTEAVTQQVPVQSTVMEPVTEMRRVPYTYQRQVTEHVTQRVPVQQERLVAEIKTRRVPVQTQRMVYETQVQQEPVQVCRMETEVRSYSVPRTIPRLEEYRERRLVPRTVLERIPVSYYDPYVPAMTSSSAISTMPMSTYPVASSTSQTPIVQSAPLTNGTPSPTPATPATQEPSRLDKIQTESSGSSQESPSDDDKMSAPSMNSPASFRSRKV
jgi:hypothetical protein